MAGDHLLSVFLLQPFAAKLTKTKLTQLKTGWKTKLTQLKNWVELLGVTIYYSKLKLGPPLLMSNSVTNHIRVSNGENVCRK